MNDEPTIDELIAIIDDVMERYPTTDMERTTWRWLRAELHRLQAIESIILRERPRLPR